MLERHYDRAAQDIGNIVNLGHVNVSISDQHVATNYYVTGLGLTRDPFLMTGSGNMWINAGMSQFHLPIGKPEVVRGVTGLVIPDREALLAFYDFPAEHWKHLRTTNPIESTFATVRHRTVRSKGCLSNRTAIAMVFKLAQAAEKSWRRLDGHSQLPKLITGVKFIDGIEAVSQPPLAA